MTPNPTPNPPNPQGESGAPGEGYRWVEVGEQILSTDEWEYITEWRITDYAGDECQTAFKYRRRIATPTPQEGPTPREDCFKALQCMYLACESQVADDVSTKVKAFVAILERQLAEAKSKIANLDDAGCRLLADNAALRQRVAELQKDKDRLDWLEPAATGSETPTPLQRVIDEAIVEQFQEKVRTLERQLAESRAEHKTEVISLRAERDRLKATQQWQPIETAPKDGDAWGLGGPRILGWCEAWQDWFVVRWSPGRPFPHWTVDSGAVVESAPTHWMPLPAAKPEERA